MKSRLNRFLSLLVILTAAAISLVGQISVYAQDQPTPTPTPTPTFRLDVPYPILADKYGLSFNFEIDLRYSGGPSKLFNLSTTSLDGWTVEIMAGAKEVSSVQLTPFDEQTPVIETVNIYMSPSLRYPDPGTYGITFKAISESLSQSMDLKAIVVPQYSFYFTTDVNDTTGASSNPSIGAKAGQGNLLSFSLVNQGSAAIENLSFSSTEPAGWEVTFNPETVGSLGTGLTQQVDSTITPPAEAKPGDYLLTLKADNGTVSSTMNVRVSVVASTFPTWAIMLIVVVVVLGLAMFYQLFINKKRHAIKLK